MGNICIFKVYVDTIFCVWKLVKVDDEKVYLKVRYQLT